MDGRFRRVRRLEWVREAALPGEDLVVREEPLELRIAGAPVAVLMRTPGHDEELARGFLLSERVVRAAGDIRALRHCDRVDDPEAEDNVLHITLAPHVTLDLARLRRNLFSSSSCGICGRASVEDLLVDLPVIPPGDPGARIAAPSLLAWPERLREAQEVFEITGGLHAAGLFDAEGQLLVVREDIGRHNAVDKVLGWALARGGAAAPAPEPPPPLGLMVSGRVSFEIVQKALCARIPVVAAVSAPSSLAVELADRGGLTLVGFLRRPRMCIYTHPERLHREGFGPGAPTMEPR